MPFLDGVLPVENVQRRDLRELLLAKVGKDLRLTHVRFVELGGVAQLLVHVLAVEIIEGVESHVRRSLHLAKEVHLSLNCLPFPMSKKWGQFICGWL